MSRLVNFVCIGPNYADHAAEAGLRLPEEPIVFLKSFGSLFGPNDDVILPKSSQKTDWEIESGVIIGTRASDIGEADAHDHVAGYRVVNDISEQEFQLERGGTWGKGCDSFGPVGPWMVTRDEIADLQALRSWCAIDGETRQNGSTGTMIFGVARLVS